MDEPEIFEEMNVEVGWDLEGCGSEGRGDGMRGKEGKGEKSGGEGKERGIGKRLRWERMRPAQPDNLSGLQDHLSKD